MTPISHLALPHLGAPFRAIFALLDDGIDTVERLCSLSVAEVDRVPGLGPVNRKRVIEAALKLGFSGPILYVKGHTAKHRIRVKMGRAVA